MQKFQCLLFVLKQSYICYYLIWMATPLTQVDIYCLEFISHYHLPLIISQRNTVCKYKLQKKPIMK